LTRTLFQLLQSRWRTNNHRKAGEIMKIKKFVILFIIISIMSQGLVIPVQAEGINPYERFNTSLVDDMYYTDYRVPNLRSRGIGNFGDTAWVVYKNMDFGKIGPSLVELVSDTPAGYAKSVELRIDSPTGKLWLI